MLMVSFCDTANICIIYLDNFQQYLAQSNIYI